MKNIWEQLGIEPTTDQRKIKKAYANQVKNCHQEDDPKRWREIHESYKMAMSYAKGTSKEIRIPLDVQWETVRQEDVPPQEPEAEQKTEEVQEEYQEFFERIEHTGTKSQWQRQKSLVEEKMQAMMQRHAGKRVQDFCDFLESYQISQLYFELGFWESFFAILKEHKLTWREYRILHKELVMIQESIYIQASKELKIVLQKVQQYCQDREHKIRKNKCRKVFAVFACLLCIVGWFAIDRQYHEEHNEQEKILYGVKQEYISYLKEKYQQDGFSPDQFEAEPITAQIYRNGEITVVDAGYSITRKEDKEFLGYALFPYSIHEEALFCLDNCQVMELEESAKEYFQSEMGIAAGTAFVGNSEVTGRVTCLKSGAFVYHTKYTGDLSSFFAEEERARIENFMGYYYYDMESLLEPDSINGALYFFYPDEHVKTLRDRLKPLEGEVNSDWEELAQTFQKTEKVQVFLVGMPQDYYHSLFDDKDSVKYRTLAHELRGHKKYHEEEFPIQTFFVSEGYWEYESEWYHAKDVRLIQTGIYAITTDDSSEIKTEVDRSGNKIVFHTKEEGSFMFIIDKNQFGIQDSCGAMGTDGRLFLECKNDEWLTTRTEIIRSREDLLLVGPVASTSSTREITVFWDTDGS